MSRASQSERQSTRRVLILNIVELCRAKSSDMSIENTEKYSQMQLWSNVWCHDLRQTESPSHRYSPTSTFRYLDWTNDNTPALATESTWLRFVGFSFCSLHTHRFRCSPRPTELENMKIGDFNSIASPGNIKIRLQQRQQWKKPTQPTFRDIRCSTDRSWLWFSLENSTLIGSFSVQQ